VALAQKLDGSLREHRSYYQTAVSPQPWKRPTITPGAAATASVTTLQAAAPKAVTGTHPGPMDLSAGGVRRGMSPQERAKRMAEGRCFGCGEQGHISRDCLTKPRRMAVSEAALIDHSSAPEQLIDFEESGKE
jgi:hypothetical protein